MLTVYRSNRAELLAQVLAANLRLQPPPPFEQIQVVVNTWPTSRWLGEQLALSLGDCEGPFAGGIAANLRFPFPSTRLRQLVRQGLEQPPVAAADALEEGPDPWRAQNLVWPLLELLPGLLEQPQAAPLQRWLQQRSGAAEPLTRLDQALWQLGRAIADAFDDYGLYRPAMLEAWLAGHDLDGRGKPLPPSLCWQPLLLRQLAERLDCLPFGVRARALIRQLQQRAGAAGLPALEGLGPLRLFGLSSLAPVQVELLQALSACLPVELYLLTPCRDLWQRRDASAPLDPLDASWLVAVPGLEARFGRLGAEFQQLLEGSGEAQLGQWREGDLFFAPASVRRAAGEEPSLLEQLQEQLAGGHDAAPAQPLRRRPDDHSLEFHACPGRLRQLQIVRDRLLQLMAADPSLEPRDILVMTPQVEAFAPLVGAVFGDAEATGVQLPWRLTDRSQQSEAGISQGLLALLRLGGERLSASALEQVMGCGPLLAQHQIEAADAGAITALLQRCGFRWGLDAAARGGDPCHSLAWAIDRLVLGLVLPQRPGLAPSETAPLAMEGSLEQQGRWLALLRQLRDSLSWLGRERRVGAWCSGLRLQLAALFGDGGERSWELQTILAVLAEWQESAGESPLLLAAPVVAEVLEERLSEGSGRFGHRSGALTISALEPMRAIPHRVVVLMGLDAGSFPRQRERPGFHLLEQQRQLGDPSSSDQDRYVLLESLLSARQHLLLSWSCRDERTGERLEASTPVRQWLKLLEQQLAPGPHHGGLPLREHAPNPLERSNFQPDPPWPPASCDQRLLAARQQLEQHPHLPLQGLALRDAWTPSPSQPQASPPGAPADSSAAWDDLCRWLENPQRHWLEQLGLRPREWEEPLLDLESLRLEERERAALLRSQLAQGEPSSTTPAPDWRRLARGRGLLPPLAAGELERQLLEQRWQSLTTVLEQLGPLQQRLLAAADLEAILPWRGNQLVLAHAGRPRSRERLRLWLQLLLASAADAGASGAVLVGRDGQRFRVLERLEAPAPAQARAWLAQLLSWRQQHQSSCWPLPPETGWAFAAAEHHQSGSGRSWSKARDVWEGGYTRRAERREPEQALCFGADYPVRDLLQPAVCELAVQLHGPLLAHWREVKP